MSAVGQREDELSPPRDPRAMALAAEPERVRVRSSALAFAVAAVPGLVAAGAFLAIWFAALLASDGRAGRAHPRFLGQRIETDPAIAWAWFVTLGAMIGMLVLWNVVRRFRDVASSTIGIHDRAVVARSRRGTVVLPFADMGRVRVDRFLTGARLSLRAPGAPTLILSRRDAARLAAALRAAGVDCEMRAEAGLPDATPVPDEEVLWSGRPGFRGFDRTRALLAIIGGAPAIVFAIWLGGIWTGPGPLLDRLLWSFAALALVGGTAMTVLVLHAGTIADWLRDLVGTVAVTGNRVVWRAPFGDPYREIPATRILSADIVESDGRRGWVALRVEGDRPGRARDVDLFGLPDPDGAVAAIRTAMARAKQG